MHSNISIWNSVLLGMYNSNQRDRKSNAILSRVAFKCSEIDIKF